MKKYRFEIGQLVMWNGVNSIYWRITDRGVMYDYPVYSIFSSDVNAGAPMTVDVVFENSLSPVLNGFDLLSKKA